MRRTCAISSTRATSSPSRVRRSSAADWTRTPSPTTTFLPTTSATTAWKTPPRRRPRPCSSSRIPSRTRRSTIFPPSSAPSQSSTRAAIRRRRRDRSGAVFLPSEQRQPRTDRFSLRLSAAGRYGAPAPTKKFLCLLFPTTSVMMEKR